MIRRFILFKKGHEKGHKNKTSPNISQHNNISKKTEKLCTAFYRNNPEHIMAITNKKKFYFKSKGKSTR